MVSRRFWAFAVLIAAHCGPRPNCCSTEVLGDAQPSYQRCRGLSLDGSRLGKGIARQLVEQLQEPAGSYQPLFVLARRIAAHCGAGAL